VQKKAVGSGLTVASERKIAANRRNARAIHSDGRCVERRSPPMPTLPFIGAAMTSRWVSTIP
jgi:hypothetical protein